MSTYSYTVTGLGSSPATIQPVPASQIDRLFGRDILWKRGEPSVSPAGDWILVEGEAALSQWVVHCIVTNPGEYATHPNYGVGARAYLRTRDTRASRDELTNRTQSQLVTDPRIDSVEDVVIQRVSDGVLKMAVAILPKGRTRRAGPLLIAVEIR